MSWDCKIDSVWRVDLSVGCKTGCECAIAALHQSWGTGGYGFAAVIDFGEKSCWKGVSLLNESFYVDMKIEMLSFKASMKR